MAQSKIAGAQNCVLRAGNIILLFGAAALDLICAGPGEHAYVFAGDEWPRRGRKTQIVG